jgi:hypothetical protein
VHRECQPQLWLVAKVGCKLGFRPATARKAAPIVVRRPSQESHGANKTAAAAQGGKKIAPRVALAGRPALNTSLLSSPADRNLAGRQTLEPSHPLIRRLAAHRFHEPSSPITMPPPGLSTRAISRTTPTASGTNQSTVVGSPGTVRPLALECPPAHRRQCRSLPAWCRVADLTQRSAIALARGDLNGVRALGNAEITHPPIEAGAITVVAVMNEKTWRLVVPTAAFNNLLCRPLGARMRCHVHVKNLPVGVMDHEEHVWTQKKSHAQAVDACCFRNDRQCDNGPG